MEQDKIGEWVKNICTGVMVLTFCLLLLFVLTKEIPKSNEQTANLMLGTLGTLVIMVFGYWWGSSASSARNAKRLNDVLNTAIPTGGSVQQTTTQTTKVQKDGEQPPS
ncbi:MAG: hypothetical protein V4714_08340 [Bacteroidota bacterium]